MDNGGIPRLRRIPRPHFGLRHRPDQTITNSNLVELETLSPVSALDHRTVTLSQDEIQVCCRLADLLLQETLQAYDPMNQHILPQDWKLVKKKDQLGVYKQRKHPLQVHHVSAAASETELPLLVVIGHLAGHVNDAMYGLVSANTRAMKLNSAYARDSLEDAQVLNTIEGPTIEEPFRFLGLKWTVRHGTMSTSSFVKRRDLLYLEATGVTKMVNGERVGYRVMHSVSIKALAQLAATTISSSVIRARASVVQLFHQQQSSEGSGGVSGTLNVFTRGYYDPQGGMMHFLAVNAGIELLLHMTFSVVDCAHLKKIAYAAQRAGRRQNVTSQLHKANYGDEGMAGIEEIGDEDADVIADKACSTNCSLCDRRLGSLLNRSGVPCTICAKMVCWRCSVVKKLRFFVKSDTVDNGVDLEEIMGLQHFDQHEASRASTERSSSGSGSVMMTDIGQKAFKFCLPCVLRANHRNASQIVVEELLEQTNVGLVTPRHAMDCAIDRSCSLSIRRRSTQTGRAHNLPPVSVSPSPPPRQKAHSSEACVPNGVFRSSSAFPRVVLYVDDEAPTRRKTAQAYNVV